MRRRKSGLQRNVQSIFQDAAIPDDIQVRRTWGPQALHDEAAAQGAVVVAYAHRPQQVTVLGIVVYVLADALPEQQQGRIGPLVLLAYE